MPPRRVRRPRRGDRRRAGGAGAAGHRADSRRQPARPGLAPKGRRRGGRGTRLLRQPDDRVVGLRRAGAGGRGRLRAHRLRRGRSHPRDRGGQRRPRAGARRPRLRPSPAGSRRLPGRHRPRARWRSARTSLSGIPSDAATRAGRPWPSRRWAWSLPSPTGCRPIGCCWARSRDWVGGDDDARPYSARRPGCGGSSSPTTAWSSDGPAGWLTSPGGTAPLVSALAGAAASMVVEPCLPDEVATAAADLGLPPRQRRRPCGRRWATESVTATPQNWQAGRSGPPTRSSRGSRPRAGGACSGLPDAAAEGERARQFRRRRARSTGRLRGRGCSQGLI